MKVVLFVLGIIFGQMVMAQPQSYPCKTAGNENLSGLIGTWQVVARDRISPGNYETNKGVSVISSDIAGCSISEAYQGVFKNKAYAISATMLLIDSMKLQRTYHDSEHASLMLFEGNISGDVITLYWYRDQEKRKMQVKYELVKKGADAFEWKTELSTDYGVTWQITHHWQYERMSSYNSDDAAHKLIKVALDKYHDGLSKGDSQGVLEALSPGFVMFNGNYSGEAINWQAHMYLTGEDLAAWPGWFIEQAGPYQNEYEIISVHTRANAALVITRDTGSNKFRHWQNEQTMWLLGKHQNQYKILAYYLKDISNP